MLKGGSWTGECGVTARHPTLPQSVTQIIIDQVFYNVKKESAGMARRTGQALSLRGGVGLFCGAEGRGADLILVYDPIEGGAVAEAVVEGFRRDDGCYRTKKPAGADL
jgi:hypothetical protein